MPGWRAALGGLIDALLPPSCVVCGEPAEAGARLCPDCVPSLPWRGEAAVDAVDAGRLGLDAVVAPLRYSVPVDGLVHRLKFSADLAAGRALAEALLMAVRDRPPPQALVPMALHWRRLAVRGHDQSLELARPLGRALGVPVLATALCRQRHTAAQARLKAGARRRNLLGAFRVRGPLPAHVAIVDDVMTTGASLQAAAEALRQAGVEVVEAWAVARAAAPDSAAQRQRRDQPGEHQAAGPGVVEEGAEAARLRPVAGQPELPQHRQRGQPQAGEPGPGQSGLVPDQGQRREG